MSLLVSLVPSLSLLVSQVQVLVVQYFAAAATLALLLRLSGRHGHCSSAVTPVTSESSIGPTAARPRAVGDSGPGRGTCPATGNPLGG